MSKTFKCFLIILVSLFFILIVWQLNIRVGLADYYFFKIRHFNEWENSLKNYQKVFKYFPNEPYYNRKFALDLLWSLGEFYHSNENKVKIIDLAIKRLESMPEKTRTFQTITYLSRLYSKKGNLTGDSKDFDKAIGYIKKAANISPKMAGVYNDWCQIEIYQKNWDKAKDKCQKALSLYPDLNDPRVNTSHRKMIEAEMSQVYEKLGIIFREENEYGVAEQMYVQVIRFFPLQKKYIWKKIADLYYIQDDLDQAIKNNLHGFVLNPKDSAWSRALSLLYKEKGSKEKAEFWSERVKKLEEK